MQTKPTSFKNILLILTAAKMKNGLYATFGLISALLFSAILLSESTSAQTQKPTRSRGAEAVEQLKQKGQYDSLLAAVKAVRKSERTNSPQAFTQTTKLTADDGAPASFFGYSVAISGDTAIVGAPLESLETVNPSVITKGSAYIFTRSGASWSLQQELSASDGASRDNFGVNVAIDGNTVVVGAHLDDVGANSNQGSAYVFIRSGTVWTEQAKLTAAQGAAGDRFGIGLEISGDTIVVGTRRDQGAAYVFTRSGTTWTQQQQILPSDGTGGDEFGVNVAISGETILVSAAGRSESGGEHQGAVYVFVRSGASWTQQQKLTTSDGAAGDRFGSDITIAGDTAIIGAFQDDVGANADQGSAYVFTRSGTVWTQQQKLTASDGAAGDRFGSSVAISGNTAVVGSPLNDNLFGSTPVIDAGSAYVFTGSGAAWTQQANLIPFLGGDDGDNFGGNVAISGNTLVVGINEYSDGSGTAIVYARSGTSWSVEWNFNSDDSSGDSFGSSVAIDGDTAIVGAAGDQIGANVDQGSAYIFVRSGATWTLQQKIIASDGSADDRFGSNVAISGNTVVVGLYFYADVPSVYVFTRSGASWTQQQKLTASDGAEGDQFGVSVAISGDTIVVSATGDDLVDGSLQNEGSAYVFARSGAVWTQQQKLVSANPNGIFYGSGVAVSSDTIMVGAAQYDDGTSQNLFRGEIDAYVRLGATWTRQQTIIASDASKCSQFGIAVAISGDTVVATTRPINNLSTCSGVSTVRSAYVFTRSGASWTQQQKLVPSATAPTTTEVNQDSVSISGDTLVLGLDRNNPNPSESQSAAYVYARSNAVWTLKQTIPSLSSHVGISGSTIIIGAPSDVLDITGNQDIDFTSPQGAAYIFSSVGRTEFDFDGDGKSDLSVFRPSENNWYIQRSTDGFTGLQFGLSIDQLAPADYDGDGKTDVAVWREAEGNFYILNSSNNSVRIENFGLAGDFLTVSDWDGDGKADLSTYRDGAQSYFFYRGSNNNPSGNITYLPWGTTGDKSVRGDFDGDGKFDAAVFRPSNATWYIRNSSDGSIRYENWGLASDRFIPADYDGDGKTDVAVFRNGVWYIKQSSNNQPRYETFGLASDQLAAADYDGDGKADIAVFRNGIWYIKQSSAAGISYENFGISGDKAVQSTFIR